MVPVELGIDLGTSNTVAFLRRDPGSGPVEPVLFDGAPLLPSAVFCNTDGALLVGRDALHSARTRPERFEGNPKRRIDDGSVLLGQDVPVADLFAALLRRVAGEAERVAARPVVRCTISHPASWGAGRRGVLQQAAALAGLGEIRLVPEPVAAAAYHARRHGLPPGRVADLMVYDLGAGTFDVAIVRHSPGAPLQVLSSTGLDDTGGQDIDATIVGLLRGRAATAGHPGWARLEHPTTVADQQLRRQLWDDVRAAKEMLSRTSSTDLYLPLLDTDDVLTRDELEALAAPLLQRTINTVHGAIAGAPVTLQPLSAVILVGGATRMPLVATMLHRALGIAPTVIEQPEVVVAAGCLDPMVTPSTLSVPAFPSPVFPAVAPAAPGPPVSGPPASPPPVSPPFVASPVSPVPMSAISPSPVGPAGGPPGYPPPMRMPAPAPLPVPAPMATPRPPVAMPQIPRSPTPTAFPPAPVGVPTLRDGRSGVVQLVELAFPTHQGVTLRGQLWDGGGAVQYVFPSDGRGSLLLFADTNALGRYAAAHAADDLLLATPPWHVRADPTGGLNFDFDLVVEHLNSPPENWLPAFLCRCRDVAAQLALYLNLEEALDLLEQYAPIDQADTVLRNAGDSLGRAARRQIAKIDLTFLRDEWATLVGVLDAATTAID
jgi:hypothetical protein